MARDPLKVLVVTGGHPFEQEPFLAIFDDVYLNPVLEDSVVALLRTSFDRGT